MSDRGKIYSSHLSAFIKVAFGFIMLILVFSACKRTTVTTITRPGIDSIPASITIDSGDNQIGIKGYELPVSPTVLVRNKAGNPLQGISVSFTPCAGCGSMVWDNAITNQYGIVSSQWVLGTLSDSIQSMKVKVLNDTNLSVIFKATARVESKHHFIGTFYITGLNSDTSFLQLEYGGISTFRVNTKMPLEMDSLFLDTLQEPRLPTTVIINGSRTPSTGASCCFVVETEGGPGGAPYHGDDSTAYSYILLYWTFTGTLTNNVFSGTFQAVYDYYVEPPHHYVYRGESSFSGIFSVTQQ
jgi:hypothetical protein